MSMSTGAEHPLPQPDPAKVRSDWAERIEEAKRARAMGRALRKGKPATFADRRAQRRTPTG